VLPEVKSHTPPITKGNSPGEGKKKKESDFCLMKREKKKINFRTQFRRTVKSKFHRKSKNLQEFL
jgi:hypothetical protein